MFCISFSSLKSAFILTCTASKCEMVHHNRQENSAIAHNHLHKPSENCFLLVLAISTPMKVERNSYGPPTRPPRNTKTKQEEPRMKDLRGSWASSCFIRTKWFWRLFKATTRHCPTQMFHCITSEPFIHQHLSLWYLGQWLPDKHVIQNWRIKTVGLCSKVKLAHLKSLWWHFDILVALALLVCLCIICRLQYGEERRKRKRRRRIPTYNFHWE